MLSNTISVETNPFTIYSTNNISRNFFNTQEKISRMYKEFESDGIEYSSCVYNINKLIDIELISSIFDPKNISIYRKIFSNKIENNYLEGSDNVDDILANSNDRKLYYLTIIKCNDKSYILNSFISFNLVRDGLYFTISYEPLGIEIFEKSLENALECFNEEFAMLWKLYALEDDDNLSGDALLLKQKLLTCVRGTII